MKKKNKPKKHIDVSIYFALNPRDTHVSMRKNKQGSCDVTCRAPQNEATAKKKRKKKGVNILCVDWSIADLAMVHCRSNPFPMYGIFTHS